VRAGLETAAAAAAEADPAALKSLSQLTVPSASVAEISGSAALEALGAQAQRVSAAPVASAGLERFFSPAQQ
jgi:hypothetical protein